MTQSKTQSMIETFANVGVGFCISFLASLLILPAFGVVVSVDTNFGITLAFTVVSVTRMYIIRRYYNGR